MNRGPLQVPRGPRESPWYMIWKPWVAKTLLNSAAVMLKYERRKFMSLVTVRSINLPETQSFSRSAWDQPSASSCLSQDDDGPEQWKVHFLFLCLAFLWHVHDSVTINYWTGGRDIILYHELLIRNHICPSARFHNSSNQMNVYIFSPSVFIISCFIVDVICLRKFASQTLDFHLFMFDQHFFFFFKKKMRG